MAAFRHITLLRVRYSETDQMGSYYNSRVLEWFECGRTELMRALGKPYRDLELQGLRLPISEAHVEYLGRARYDDPLKITSTLSMAGRARFRFDVEIEHGETGGPVCRGYTIHVAIGTSGKPIRPPRWLVESIESARSEP
jgi:acyl-CoA thioester hydrolase